MPLMKKLSRSVSILFLVICLICLYALPLLAQTTDAATTDPVPVELPQGISLWSTIHSGGIIGYIIILMSFASLSLIIRNYLSTRESRLLPPDFVNKVKVNLQEKDYDHAADLCEKDGSFIAQIIGAGLTQVGSMFGFYDMQNAMQEISEREISKLHRKLEYLSFIASTAPMMGLLGTVLGMIKAFNQIAITEGAARPSQLAGGISQALVTTSLGLIVAIPTMFFVAFFRNRIENTINESESVVETLMGHFRKEK